MDGVLLFPGDRNETIEQCVVDVYAFFVENSNGTPDATLAAKKLKTGSNRIQSTLP